MTQVSPVIGELAFEQAAQEIPRKWFEEHEALMGMPSLGLLASLVIHYYATSRLGLNFYERSGLEAVGGVAATSAAVRADITSTYETCDAQEEAQSIGIPQQYSGDTNWLIKDDQVTSEHIRQNRKVLIQDLAIIGLSILPFVWGPMTAGKLTASFSNKRKTARLQRATEIALDYKSSS